MISTHWPGGVFELSTSPRHRRKQACDGITGSHSLTLALNSHTTANVESDGGAAEQQYSAPLFLRGGANENFEAAQISFLKKQQIVIK
jgi:hypothetical protein